MRPHTTRTWLIAVSLLAAVAISATSAESGSAKTGRRSITVAVVQFNAIPEAVDQNLAAMERLARAAVKLGAHWVVFHEASNCDYTDKLSALAEPVPCGRSTIRMSALAKELGCFLSFGLSERDGDRFYITQVFVGPEGFVHRYRKTWLHKEPLDGGFRNEYARYDPGTGPEPFEIDGVRATCFICSDSTSPRCIARARDLRPDVVFFPVNIVTHHPKDLQTTTATHARTIGAPLLSANRVGDSWSNRGGQGGAAIYSATGEVLARAKSDGQEEIVLHRLEVPVR
ncbi:MAG: carbon-nitrogen hydrolase family protein [Isosphaeraceae bacterium]|nr:carbon-nitrogen hydrolase family protein [Isosphaeraceae bacterium]